LPAKLTEIGGITKQWPWKRAKKHLPIVISRLYIALFPSARHVRSRGQNKFIGQKSAEFEDFHYLCNQTTKRNTETSIMQIATILNINLLKN
jgi:hypothetical protein